MRWPRGVRARLVGALVPLVALTAAVLGVGASVFVDARLHAQTLTDASDQAKFDLTVIVPGRPPAGPTDAGRHRASGLIDTFRQRGVETLVDLGDDPTVQSNDALDGAARAIASRRPGARRTTASSPTPGSTSRARRAWSWAGWPRVVARRSTSCAT